MTKSGGDNQRARRTQFSRFIDNAGNGTGRRSENHELGYERQFSEAGDSRNAVDVPVTRIDDAEFALEPRRSNVSDDGVADRPRARTCSNQCDRTRRKQIVQTVGRHPLNGPDWPRGRNW
jgi:hypothetical protein